MREIPTVLPNSSEAIAASSAPAVAAEPQRFSNRRAYAQTFTATLVIRCLGVGSGVLAARLLGPAGRGELAVIIFLPMLLVPVGELELPRSVAFEASRLKRLSGEFFATCFWLAVALGALQAVILAVTLPFYLPADKLHLLPAARWFMIYLPAAYVAATLMGSDQGRGRFGRFSFLLALPGGLYLAGILAVWAAGRATPVLFAFSLLAATLVTAGVRAAMDGRGILASAPDWALASRLLKRGFNYYLPAIAGFLLARADMFIVVRLAPVDEIGFYAVAQAIALGQIGAVNPFVQVGFSAVAGETDPGQALQTLARHFRLAQLAVVGVGAVAAALTPWIIKLLFGARFAAAIPTAYLLIVATAFWGMGQVLDQGLRAAGHPRIGIASNLLGLGLMLGVGVPACMRFGIGGVAMSLLIAQFVNLGFLIAYCLVRLQMSPRQFWALDGESVNDLRGVALSLVLALRGKAARDRRISGTYEA